MDKGGYEQTAQDIEGRLWDVLYMLRSAITKTSQTNCILYQLLIVLRDGKSKRAKLTKLKAMIGSGDNGEPVITIMLPDED